MANLLDISVALANHNAISRYTHAFRLLSHICFISKHLRHARGGYYNAPHWWDGLDSTQSAPLNNSMRAAISGGLSGSLILLPFAIADLSNRQFMALFYFALLFLLGAWSGWAGERWARRHVKVNPDTAANHFD